MLCPMDTPMTKVSLNAFDAIVQQHKSDATSGKIDDINECLRLREIAVGLEAQLKAPVPSL